MSFLHSTEAIEADSLRSRAELRKQPRPMAPWSRGQPWPLVALKKAVYARYRCTPLPQLFKANGTLCAFAVKKAASVPVRIRKCSFEFSLKQEGMWGLRLGGAIR